MQCLQEGHLGAVWGAAEAQVGDRWGAAVEARWGVSAVAGPAAALAPAVAVALSPHSPGCRHCIHQTDSVNLQRNSTSSSSHFRIWWEPLTKMQSEMRQKADNTCGLFKLILTSPLDSLTLIPWPLATLGPDPEFPWTPRSSQHTYYRPTAGHGNLVEYALEQNRILWVRRTWSSGLPLACCVLAPASTTALLSVCLNGGLGPRPPPATERQTAHK